MPVPWSAFVAWLSDLDPKSGGIGIETRLFCPAEDSPSARFACDPDRHQKAVIKASAAILLGTLNEDGGTISVMPVLGSVETDVNEHPLCRCRCGGDSRRRHARRLRHEAAHSGSGHAQDPATSGLGIRPELNVIPKGFPAGAFAVGAPETGTEVVPGLSVVFSFK